jgi:hypothetical protein
MDKAIVSTLEEMPRIQITTENRDAKEEKEFGWSKDPFKNATVEDRSRVSEVSLMVELQLILGFRAELTTSSRVGRWQEGQGRIRSGGP